MHASSLENMVKCRDRYYRGTALEAQEIVTIFDFGGADVNGTYRPIFDSPNINYRAADLVAGPKVDIVLESPYQFPLADESVDLLISGQAFEHCEFFWLAFVEFIRVVKRTGLIFLIAPSTGPIHRYPVDCYRFYPDAYRALARYAECHLIGMWLDERGPWCDLVGIFSKSAKGPARIAPIPAQKSPPAPLSPRPAEEEAERGDAPYTDVLALAHKILSPAFYLEVGVGAGRSLRLANCKAVGVDPAPTGDLALPPNASLVRMASDDFFEHGAAELSGIPLELAFIDGMHHFEFALRDFMNIERRVAPGALIVVDDIFPVHPAQAQRRRTTLHWMGDVWRLYQCLKAHRPDLFMLPVDASEAGLLLVAGLDRNNRILWNRYSGLFLEHPITDDPPPSEILGRVGALSAHDPFIAEMFSLLRNLRVEKAEPRTIVMRLRAAYAARASVLR
jgi:SAM-dependent methyltransferase